MKNRWRIPALLVCLVLVSAVSLAAEPQYDMRKVVWGMTMNEVLMAETQATYDCAYPDSLFYRDVLICDYFPALLFYSFNNNRLAGAAYFFDEIQYTDKNLYLLSYDVLKQALIQKYGTPKTDIKDWLNPLFRNDTKNWGYAIGIGHLIYKTSWITHRTSITLDLRARQTFAWVDGKDLCKVVSGISLAITYYSKEFYRKQTIQSNPSDL